MGFCGGTGTGGIGWASAARGASPATPTNADAARARVMSERRADELRCGCLTLFLHGSVHAKRTGAGVIAWRVQNLLWPER
jgi:hypothetical protein